MCVISGIESRSAACEGLRLNQSCAAPVPSLLDSTLGPTLSYCINLYMNSWNDSMVDRAFALHEVDLGLISTSHMVP